MSVRNVSGRCLHNSIQYKIRGLVIMLNLLQPVWCEYFTSGMHVNSAMPTLNVVLDAKKSRK